HKGELFQKLAQGKSDFYYVPEGGTNRFALPGVGEIVDECHAAGIHPDYFVTPAGTGGTAAGLLSRGEKVVAVAVLKNGGFLENDIRHLLDDTGQSVELDLQTGYHFGGYGKYTAELLQFITDFEKRHEIPLE